MGLSADELADVVEAFEASEGKLIVLKRFGVRESRLSDRARYMYWRFVVVRGSTGSSFAAAYR